MVNRLLSQHRRVAYLDTDCGQPEFTPPVGAAGQAGSCAVRCGAAAVAACCVAAPWGLPAGVACRLPQHKPRLGGTHAQQYCHTLVPSSSADRPHTGARVSNVPGHAAMQGVLSLHLLDTPVFGAPHTHMRTPELAYFQARPAAWPHPLPPACTAMPRPAPGPHQRAAAEQRCRNALCAVPCRAHPAHCRGALPAAATAAVTTHPPGLQGDVSSQSDPARYLQAVLALHAWYCAHAGSSGGDAGNDAGPVWPPLVINMHGWITGLGFDLLVEMLRGIGPTHGAGNCQAAAHPPACCDRCPCCRQPGCHAGGTAGPKGGNRASKRALLRLRARLSSSYHALHVRAGKLCQQSVHVRFACVPPHLNTRPAAAPALQWSSCRPATPRRTCPRVTSGLTRRRQLPASCCTCQPLQALLHRQHRGWRAHRTSAGSPPWGRVGAGQLSDSCWAAAAHALRCCWLVRGRCWEAAGPCRTCACGRVKGATVTATLPLDDPRR